MFRAFPYDTFLGDPAIAHCYSRIRAQWKLNSRIWGMTVRRMGDGAGKLPDNGSGVVPGDSKNRRTHTMASQTLDKFRAVFSVEPVRIEYAEFAKDGFTEDDIKAGSTLTFRMGELPNTKWGAGKKDAPPVVK